MKCMGQVNRELLPTKSQDTRTNKGHPLKLVGGRAYSQPVFGWLVFGLFFLNTKQGGH